jgi:hypothetical protein
MRQKNIDRRSRPKALASWATTSKNDFTGLNSWGVFDRIGKMGSILFVVRIKKRMAPASAE